MGRSWVLPHEWGRVARRPGTASQLAARDVRGGDASSAGSSRFAGRARRRALLLLGRGADVDLRQVADDHDLVVLDGDFYSREPAVREPSGKPTFDRTELFLIHALHNYTVINQMSRPSSPSTVCPRP